MVGHFVRLKLRLLSNRLRHAEWQVVVGLILLSLMAVAAAAGTAVGLWALARFAPEWRSEVAVFVFVGAGILWIIGPVVTSAMDDTLEPRAFETLPLSPARLGAGLLAASLIGPGGLGTGVALVVGSLGAFPTSVLTVPAVIVSATIGVLLVVATGRWVVTVLSDLMRSRRSREVVAVMFAVVVGAPAMLGGFVGANGIEPDRLTRLAELARWTPPGAVGWATESFGAGRWSAGALGLSIGLASLLVVLWLYGTALRRLQLRPPGVAGAGPRRRSARRWPWLSGGPVGAMAVKELRYAVRDARLRSQFLGAAIGIGAVLVALGTTVLDTPYAPFAGMVVALLILLPVVTNQFGVDAGSFWVYLVAVPDLGLVLRGKNLGWAMVVVPLGSLVTVGTALISGNASYVLAAWLTIVALTTLWMAVGNPVSIVGAFALPESNMFGNSNVGGSVLLWSLAGLGALALAQVPPALAVGLTAWLAGPVWATIAALASVGYAMLLYRLSWRLTDWLLAERSHRLLETLDAA